MVFAALAISVLALVFTVVSFWWLHARSGDVLAYEPGVWAAFVSRDRSGIRIPLVVHNTGAAAVVVLAMRLRFTEGGEAMDWEWTRKTVETGENDIEDLAQPFSVAGRGVRELVPEFVGVLPGVVPDPRAYSAVVEARTSDRGEWAQLLAFELQLGNLKHPTRYIPYSNRPDYLPDEDRAEADAALAKLRRDWKLD